MFRLICLAIFLTFLPAAASSSPQRDYPEVEKPKPKPKAPKPARPRGPRVAQNRANGVLFVLTDPPKASVLIKSGSVTVKQGVSGEGQFRAELPPGLYRVEVTSAGYKPFTTSASVKQVGTEPVQADLVPTTGSILIGLGSLDTDANILIDGKKPEKAVKVSENQIEIPGLEVGQHSVRVSHASIVDWEKKVEVEGGATTTVTPKFAASIVNLVIKSEPGAEVFVDNNYEGRIADNGELRITNIKPGERAIRVVKDKFEPVTLTRRFAPGGESLNLTMKRVVFSEPFADSFLGGSALWELPKSWQVTTGKMLVKSATPGLSIGLVKGNDYADFTMEFDVSFSNGKGAVWIVRARDSQNFYLFQLIGPKGAGRNTFHSFAYQNGQLRQLKPPEFLALDLSRPGDSFHITVELRGSSIKHFIEVSSAPQAAGRQPLSVLSDNTFSHGAVGFGVKDNEEFLVYFVNITPDR